MARNHSPAINFPLRWETTGDTWQYASPIDCAAANGHYDLVRELLRLDPDLLLSLTSLRRLRRLDSLWDSAGAAKSRAAVARRLLLECEAPSDINKSNHLIAAGCGGWLLYAAAAAGDLEFVNDLLDRRPLLVFGEGEYGLSDMFYAAARSDNPEVFRVLYDFAVSPRFEGSEGESSEMEVNCVFRKEVAIRAVHAAARGGNLAVLTEFIGGDGDRILNYRDGNGCNILHAAAASGQVEVVKYLITTYDDIISSTDNEGNTALHVAAYKGQLAVVEVLLSASPASVSETNKAGNTLLHMAVAGALSPGFERLDRHIELVKQLTQTRNNYKVEEVINAKNNGGRTALHIAIIGNVHSDLVQHLMTARYLHVNARDDHGMTPLDYLKQQPRSSISEMLITQLISVGGMSYCHDNSARKDIGSRMKMQDVICSSPETSFRDLDSEIFKSLGIKRTLSSSSIDHREVISRLFPSPSEMSFSGSNHEEEDPVWTVVSKKRGGRLYKATKSLKNLFRWLSMKKRRMNDDSDGYSESLGRRSSFCESPVSLRDMYLGSPSMPSNKRTLSERSSISSPTNTKKSAFGAGMSQSLLSKTSNSPYSSLDKEIESDGTAGSPLTIQDEAEEAPRMMHKQESSRKKFLMNQYLCFGGSVMPMKIRIARDERHPINGNKHPVQTVACT